MFHSYKNPNHLCAECSQTCNTDCGLRFIYCLRPHGSDVIDVPLPGQPILPPGTDNITFTDDFIIQIRDGVNRGNNVWNRSNPFTQQLRQWPVSFDPISHSINCHVHTGKSAILHCRVPFSKYATCGGQVPD